MSVGDTSSITIVIPTFRRNAELALCLEGLRRAAHAAQAANFQVIVTDDARDAACRQMLQNRFPWASWVEGPQRGPAANRNNGAGRARARWVVFCDDDCVPEAGWVGAYVAAIAAGDARVLEGRTVASGVRDSFDKVCPINETGGYLWSCNFGMELALFREFGGFDESFPYAAMEDVDLHHRLRQAGEPVRFLRDAVVAHPWRQAGGWRALRNQRACMLRYLDKFPEELATMPPAYFLRATASLVLRDLLPNILRFRGRGMWWLFLQALINLRLAYDVKLRRLRG